MKRLAKFASTVAGVVVAGSILTGTVMAAPPEQAQAQAGQTVAGSGLHMNSGIGMRGAPTWAGFEEEVATFLGMSQEQIQAERLAGTSLLQIAQAKGKTEQQLVSTILAAKKADLDKAVADKTITQAQADLVYEHMQTQVAQMVSRTATGPASGQGAGNQMGGMQRGRGMGRWANPSS
jgi:hypothetical protein